jgi:aminoglycoside/choline kinase family phosphotransferase
MTDGMENGPKRAEANEAPGGKQGGQAISPDGSKRLFFRLCWHQKDAVKIMPAPGPEGLMEARAFFQIGTHLKKKGIPVPEIFEFDPDSGVLIVEDLGGIP